MEINLKDSKYVKRGAQMYNHNAFNKYLKSAQESLYEEVKVYPTYVAIDDKRKKVKSIFSFYEDIEYKFIKNKAIGAYYRWFIKEYPLNKEADKQKAFLVHGAMIWTNPKYNHKITNCWAYDINSAYPAALLKPIPDVNNDLGPGFVEKGKQLGFVLDKEGFLEEVKEGIASWRFEIIPSPWAKKYVPQKYRDLLHYKGIGDLEKAGKIKEEFVCAIGCLRNHNAFLYTHILTTCRETMDQFIDDDTILVNTDCIYSAKERFDIPLGTDIGLFKTLPQNGTEIFISGANYRWVSKPEDCSIRGIPKELQATYDLETKTQVKQPDYALMGDEIICMKKENNMN